MYIDFLIPKPRPAALAQWVSASALQGRGLGIEPRCGTDFSDTIGGTSINECLCATTGGHFGNNLREKLEMWVNTRSHSVRYEVPYRTPVKYWDIPGSTRQPCDKGRDK